MLAELVSRGIGFIPNSAALQNKYVVAAIIIALFAIAAKAIQFCVAPILARIAHHSRTTLDQLILPKLKHPFLLLFLSYGLQLALRHLEVDGIFANLIYSLMALFFMLIVLRSIDIAITLWGDAFARKTRTHIDEIVLPLFHKTNKVIIVIITFLWILHVWDVNLTPYLAGVGISGLILGLALQDALKNIVGGIALILDKSFALGDAIRLEGGEVGIVKEIGLRTTKILTYDHELLFVPNGQLSNMRIKNLQKPSAKIRKSVAFTIPYGADVEKIRQEVVRRLAKVGDIDATIDVVMVDVGETRSKFEARFWTNWDVAEQKLAEVTEIIYAVVSKNSTLK